MLIILRRSIVIQVIQKRLSTKVPPFLFLVFLLKKKSLNAFNTFFSLQAVLQKAHDRKRGGTVQIDLKTQKEFYVKLKNCLSSFP